MHMTLLKYTKKILLRKSNIVRNDRERRQRQSLQRCTKNSVARVKNIKTGQAAVIWIKLSCSLRKKLLMNLNKPDQWSELSILVAIVIPKSANLRQVSNYTEPGNKFIQMTLKVVNRMLLLNRSLANLRPVAMNKIE